MRLRTSCSFGGRTRQMSRASLRHDGTRRRARRLHLLDRCALRCSLATLIGVDLRNEQTGHQLRGCLQHGSVATNDPSRSVRYQPVDSVLRASATTSIPAFVGASALLVGTNRAVAPRSAKMCANSA